MRKRLKTLAKVALVAVGVLLLAAVAVITEMAREDRQHEEFLRTGRSINQFLTEYGHALADAFADKNAGPVARFYSDGYRAPGRGRWLLRPADPEGDVEVWRLAAEGDYPFAKGDVCGELEAYLSSLTAVDDVKCKIDLIEQIEQGRSAVLTVKFILDGKDQDGRTFQDRNFYRWHLANEAGPGGGCEWKIVRDELVEGVRVAGNGRGFREVDPASVGIDFKHERDPKLDPASASLRFAVIEHAFGGVSAVDYDNDGRPDLFFADGKRCRLFHNDTPGPGGEVRFTDVTDAAGLGGIGAANAGIFADVDNDGHKDLFVVRYCAPCKFFHNNGDGTFTDRSREMGLDLDAPCMAACFLDYDRDGFADLYVAVYGDAFHDVPRLPFFAQNGGKNRLFRNVGGRRFEDVTDTSGTGDTGWSMAVAAADLDNDGWPDLVVANDFGKKTLYHNNGDGTFTETTRQAGVLDFSGGMGVAVGDVDDDGRLDLYFANINSNQRWFGEDQTVKQYMRNVARTRWLLSDFGEYQKLYDLVGPEWNQLGKRVGKGNSLFRNNGDGTFAELTDSHTSRGGWGWGVAFFDMDNDADLDIFAANGWISNKLKDDL
jgi:FG-GAP-like repeat